MEIRDLSHLLRRPHPSPESVQPAGTEPGHPSREAQGAADAVQVSEQGRLLAELRRAVEALPEVRQDRVQAIREAIESGRLVPRPEVVSQALLRHGVLDDLLNR